MHDKLLVIYCCIIAYFCSSDFNALFVFGAVGSDALASHIGEVKTSLPKKDFKYLLSSPSLLRGDAY